MPDATRFGLGDGMQLAGVGLDELWWRYVAIGGAGDLASLALNLLGAEPSEEREHDLIAQALNEAFLDEGQATFPVAYTGPGRPAAPPARRPMARMTQPMSRSLEIRRQAALARLRSAAAARRAATLHATASQLMQASGQLQFSRHARVRAQDARLRSLPSVAA